MMRAEFNLCFLMALAICTPEKLELGCGNMRTYNIEAIFLGFYITNTKESLESKYHIYRGILTKNSIDGRSSMAAVRHRCWQRQRSLVLPKLCILYTTRYGGICSYIFHNTIKIWRFYQKRIKN